MRRGDAALVGASRRCLALVTGVALAGCVERSVPADGSEDDEVAEACEQACPLQFECGFASAGKTLEECLEDCPVSWKKIRDDCRAHFELFACLSTLSCEEYFAYVEALDRKPGTFGDPPAFPCQAEVLANFRECQGHDDEDSPPGSRLRAERSSR